MKILVILLFLVPVLAIAEEIKVFSWNVYMLPKPIHFSFQKERTHLISQELKNLDADIILLQEAFSTRFKNEVRKTLKDRWPHQTNLKRSRRLFHVMDSGVFLASRYPFEILGHHYFYSCAKADCFAAKGVLLIEVQLPSGKKIQIASTHTQSGQAANTVRIRQDQILGIKTLLDLYARSDVPQILTGDLNIDGYKTSEFPAALKALDMTTSTFVSVTKATNGFPVNCYKVPGKPNDGEWIDHILLNPLNTKTSIHEFRTWPALGTIKNKLCDLSDHYPVSAIIKL